MRKILLFVLVVLSILFVSCRKSVVIDSVVLTVIHNDDYSSIVRTSETVTDSILLIKSVPLLELDESDDISFMSKNDGIYATLNKRGDVYLYVKSEKRLPISDFHNSSIIYDAYKCAIISEDFVKSKLNFPLESKIVTSAHIHEVNGNEAIIINKFNAKNAFGVTTEYVYKIWMSFNGGEWEDMYNWSYSKLIIENTSTGEQKVF